MNRMLMNAKGKVSFMKLGAWIVSFAGTLLSSNIDIIAGTDIDTMVLKLIVGVGATIGVAGMRDAMDKSKEQ